MKKFISLFLFLTVILSGCGMTTASQTVNSKIIDLREGGDIEKIQHGEVVIVKGKVIVGNGKKSTRGFRTEFGTFEAQPLVIVDSAKKEWAVMLVSPSTDSLFDKAITVKGIADTKSNDPAILRSTMPGQPKAAIVKAEIIK